MNEQTVVSNHVPAAPNRMRGLLTAAFVSFIAAVLFAAITLMFHLHIISFSSNVGLVLLTFGVFKIVVALHALVAPTAQSPLSDQRQDIGSPALFRLWIAYKLTPASLAIVAAVYLFVVGAPALDRFVG
jgi:hypothetical protein